MIMHDITEVNPQIHYLTAVPISTTEHLMDLYTLCLAHENEETLVL